MRLTERRTSPRSFARVGATGFQRSIGILAIALAAASCDRATGPRAGDADTPIMFLSMRPAASGIYLMSADGGTVVSRAWLGGGSARPGDWSPDGRRIAFTSISPRVHVHLANVDGTGEIGVRDSAGESTQARWSPDGRTIIYTNNDDPYSGAINAIGVDGSHDRRLPSTADNWSSHDWSPDGAHIVFAKLESYQIPGTTQYIRVSSLFITDSTGAQLVRLTRDTTCMDVDPTWSPDGSTIAYTSCGDDPDGYSHIHVIHADGTGAKALTSGPATEYSPTWSPDGRQIAFQRGTGDDADVWLISADGSGARNLTASNPGFDGWPRWRRAARPR